MINNPHPQKQQQQVQVIAMIKAIIIAQKVVSNGLK
jgi:hypothetical protein